MDAFLSSNSDEMLLYLDFPIVVQCTMHRNDDKIYPSDEERRNFHGENVRDSDSFEQNSKVYLSSIFQAIKSP